MQRLFAFLTCFGICLSAQGFIPSLPNMLKEVLEGRTTKPSFIQLRHRVRNGSSEMTDLEEQIFHERGKTQFVWRSKGQTISGSRTREGYAIDPELRVASRSSVFLKYLFTQTSEELMNLLVSEGFARQAHTQTYKPGFQMEPDPATWNLKENFVIQPDFFLVRFPTDVAIAVAGTQNADSSRIVYFDEDLRGLRRLEWKDGERRYAWNFQQFAPVKNLGNYPKMMSFEVDGQVLVETALGTILTSDAKKHPRPTRSNASVGGNDESLLGVLLGFR